MRPCVSRVDLLLLRYLQPAARSLQATRQPVCEAQAQSAALAADSAGLLQTRSLLDAPVTMPSWSAIVQQPQADAPAAPTAQPEPAAGSTSTAVVDANAVIGGTDLRALADELVTVPEVLEECRDAQAEQRLQLLPEGLKTRTPSEEALKAGEPLRSSAVLQLQPSDPAVLQCTPLPSRWGSCTACRGWI